MKTIYIFALILFNFSLTVFAQPNYSTSSKRAIKKYNEAVKYFNPIDQEKAIELAEKAIKIDDEFIEAYLLLADIHHANKDYYLEIEYYIDAININPDLYPDSYYSLAEAYLTFKDYENAVKHLETYLTYDLTQKKIVKAQRKYESAKFAMQAIKEPVPFDPINLGTNVNTKYDDYWPSLTADEQTLVTTVRIPNTNRRSHLNSQEDFYTSFKIRGRWTPSVNVGEPLNTFDNEGAQSISSDGKSMFFTACNRPSGKGSCDIYFSRKVKNSWTKPQNLGSPINTRHFESQPSISADGKTLYFSSNRPNGFGEADIWKSELKDNGKWGKVVNLGDSINTSGKEMSPFIHSDNETLYFASDGLIGMGKLDLFVARKNENGDFQKPQNLGYPINTEQQEMGIIVNAKGNLAYFGSDRENSRKKDIYSFKLYEEARPQKMTYMKGIVMDIDTKLPLEAKIELIDLETGAIILENYTDENNGDFLVCLSTEKDYALNISKSSYLFYSENFSLKTLKKDYITYRKNIYLSPIRIGSFVILKNIFFETDSYELKKESTPELRKLLKFLKENPDVNINIYGHTDNIGSDENNEILSTNRAKAVYNYLIKNYIENYRLDYQGFGEAQPISDNETEEGRALNRRTVFEIVE